MAAEVDRRIATSPGRVAFERPDYKRPLFPATAEVELVYGRTPTVRLLDQLTPIARIVRIDLGCKIVAGRLADRVRAFQMRIDDVEFCVVVRVRMLIGSWTVGVIHARAKIRIRKVLVLVIEAERVTDFLARYEI